MPERCDEQVLDRHVVVDERQVVAEQRACRRRESSEPSSIRLTTASAVKPFAPLAIPNCVSSVFGIPWRAIGEPVRRGEHDLAVAVDADDPGEARLASEGDEGRGVDGREGN